MFSFQLNVFINPQLFHAILQQNFFINLQLYLTLFPAESMSEPRDRTPNYHDIKSPNQNFNQLRYCLDGQ